MYASSTKDIRFCIFRRSEHVEKVESIALIYIDFHAFHTDGGYKNRTPARIIKIVMGKVSQT